MLEGHVKFTKKLGKETRKFLNYLDLMLEHEAGKELRGVICRNGLDDLRASWNGWWREEKRKADLRKGMGELVVAREEWRRKHGYDA